MLLLAGCSLDPAGKTEPAELTAAASTQPTSEIIPAAGAILEAENATAVPGEGSCGEKIGRIESYLISRGGEELTGRIYTPPCYDSSLEISYPVLYLLHGATETDTQWQELGITTVADRLISAGEIAPLILVMPREYTWVALPENTFGDLLVQELIPWVALEYRTLADREYHAIGGLSRGGNWAVRLGFLHWGLFGSIGAHSTPLFYGDLERLPAWIELIPSKRMPRLYLDIGQDDNHLAVSRKLDALLTRLDYPHEWHLNPGTHDQDYWRSQLEEYLLWYSAGWKDLLP